MPKKGHSEEQVLCALRQAESGATDIYAKRLKHWSCQDFGKSLTVPMAGNIYGSMPMKLPTRQPSLKFRTESYLKTHGICVKHVLPEDILVVDSL